MFTLAAMRTECGVVRELTTTARVNRNTGCQILDYFLYFFLKINYNFTSGYAPPPPEASRGNLKYGGGDRPSPI